MPYFASVTRYTANPVGPSRRVTGKYFRSPPYTANPVGASRPVAPSRPASGRYSGVPFSGPAVTYVNSVAQLNATLAAVDALIDLLEQVRPRNALVDSMLASLEDLHNTLTEEIDNILNPLP